MFPIRSVRGEVIGFGGRVLDDGEPKYLNSPETPVFVQGPRAVRPVRGPRRRCANAATRWWSRATWTSSRWRRSGFANAVATLGTACTADHVAQAVPLHRPGGVQLRRRRGRPARRGARARGGAAARGGPPQRALPVPAARSTTPTATCASADAMRCAGGERSRAAVAPVARTQRAGLRPRHGRRPRPHAGAGAAAVGGPAGRRAEAPAAARCPGRSAHAGPAPTWRALWGRPGRRGRAARRAARRHRCGRAGRRRHSATTRPARCAAPTRDRGRSCWQTARPAGTGWTPPQRDLLLAARLIGTGTADRAGCDRHAGEPWRAGRGRRCGERLGRVPSVPTGPHRARALVDRAEMPRRLWRWPNCSNWSTTWPSCATQARSDSVKQAVMRAAEPVLTNCRRLNDNSGFVAAARVTAALTPTGRDPATLDRALKQANISRQALSGFECSRDLACQTRASPCAAYRPCAGFRVPALIADPARGACGLPPPDIRSRNRMNAKKPAAKPAPKAKPAAKPAKAHAEASKKPTKAHAPAPARQAPAGQGDAARGRAGQAGGQGRAADARQGRSQAGRQAGSAGAKGKKGKEDPKGKKPGEAEEDFNDIDAEFDGEVEPEVVEAASRQEKAKPLRMKVVARQGARADARVRPRRDRADRRRSRQAPPGAEDAHQDGQDARLPDAPGDQRPPAREAGRRRDPRSHRLDAQRHGHRGLRAGARRRDAADRRRHAPPPPPKKKPKKPPKPRCPPSTPSSAAPPTRCACTCARWARSSC